MAVNARTLRLALPVALLLVCVQVAWTQDAASDQAKALLKQGLESYKSLDFTNAKATMLKVDASALAEADKKNLEDHLAKVDDAIKKQAQAREAYNSADKALKDNDLTKAKEGFAAAACSEFLPAAEVKDAKAQLALVEKRMGASTSEPKTTDVATETKPAPVAVVEPKTPSTDTTTAEVPPLTTKTADVTPTPAPAPAVDPDQAAKAAALIAQGRTAMAKNQPDVAVAAFQQALACNPGDKTAQQLLDQAKGMIAKPVATDNSLTRLEEERAVIRQAKMMEFGRDMTRSKELLATAKSAGEFDAATDAARAARKEIEDARTYFSEKEYRSRIAEADDQIRFVAMRKDVWDRQSAGIRVREAEAKAAERVRIQDDQRRATVDRLKARARALQEQKNYKEALDVLDQIMKIDPADCYVTGWRDSMLQYAMLREEGQIQKEQNIELEKQYLDLRDSMTPWYDLMRFPKNWRELSVSRQDYTASAASETENDRVARLKLKTRIPKLEFANLEFQSVIDFFRTASNANFHVNWAALSAATVDKTTPVTLNLVDVTVEKALQTVLRDLSTNTKLSYVVDDGVITISTKDDLAKSPIIRVYDIRDLIVRVPNFAGPVINLTSSFQNGNCSSGGGSGPFDTNNTGSGNNGEENAQTRGELIKSITETITQTIDKESWVPTGTIGSIRELHGTLVVTQTAENHQALASLIESLRETRTLQVSIEARFIAISSGFLDSIGIDLDMFFNIGSGLGGGNPGGTIPPGGGNGFITDPWTGAKVPTHGTSGWGSGKPGCNDLTPVGVITQGGTQSIGFGNMLGVSTPVPGSIGSQVTSPGLSVSGIFLDDIQVDFLIQATQANSTSRTLTAPRITLFNGQRAYVTVGTQQAYVAEFEPVVSDNAVALRPRIAYIPTGSVLDVEATVSADRRYVTMTVRPQVSTLNSITTISNGFSGGTVQLPNVTLEGLMTTVNVPDGGTLLLGGQKLAAEVEREGGVPILSKIPVINRFFTNRGKVRDEQTLLILIKPKIIIPRELEEQNFPSMTK
jgi:type II secretory pathway component GspD/PulD (secretin)/tetratricopeptide (TPR) repeat protein